MSFDFAVFPLNLVIKVNAPCQVPCFTCGAQAASGRLDSQFIPRYTLLLELEWPSSWDSKTRVLCEKNLLLTCTFGPSCDEYLSRCPLPLAPLYLTLIHFEQEATGNHAKSREAEILCRGGLARSVRVKYFSTSALIGSDCGWIGQDVGSIPLGELHLF